MGTQKWNKLIIILVSSVVLVIYLLSKRKDIIVRMCNDDIYRVIIEDELNYRDRIILNITKCIDKNVKFKIEQRGDYFLLANFVRAEETFACHESVTYTTNADYSFLDNIPVLIERWNGPISISLYAPGEDFEPTLRSIAYLRNCETSLIRKYVTFHISMLSGHFPEKKPGKTLLDSYEDTYNCQNKAPYLETNILYRQANNLTYPINVLRNIAKETATTHFIFSSDVELYPSPNFISKFLDMIAEHYESHYRTNPWVYVLPVFEFVDGKPPENKTELQHMIKNRTAFLFHEKICGRCHRVPKYKEWLKANETSDLNVFTVGKRMNKQKSWEPFYVGTNVDSLFDERLSWEGQSNKMMQGLSLCLLDYDFMILDNAFLVHKSGVKKSKEQLVKFGKLVGKTNSFIKKTIKPELIKFYGNREGC